MLCHSDEEDSTEDGISNGGQEILDEKGNKASVNFDVLQPARSGCWSSMLFYYNDVYVARRSRDCSFAVYLHTQMRAHIICFDRSRAARSCSGLRTKAKGRVSKEQLLKAFASAGLSV